MGILRRFFTGNRNEHGCRVNPNTGRCIGPVRIPGPYYGTFMHSLAHNPPPAPKSQPHPTTGPPPASARRPL